jgi:SAM-dependent methyltransferase
MYYQVQLLRMRAGQKQTPEAKNDLTPRPPLMMRASPDFGFAALSEAQNYRRALLREFLPLLEGQVIEIGAGIGQFTRLLAGLPRIRSLIAVEPEAHFYAELRQVCPQVCLVQGTVADLPAGTTADTIVSLNVLEHIAEDLNELTAYAALLRPRRGTVCMFVPARPELYGPLDRAFGHRRRYSKCELRDKLRQAGFKIVRLHYFNCAGYFGWWFQFRLWGQHSFNPRAVRLFDRFIFPLGYALESRVLRPPIGQSLLAVGACLDPAPLDV